MNTANNMVVSNQWASRPNDQRFLSLQDLHRSVLARKERCTETTVALDCLQLQSTQEGDIVLLDPSGSAAPAKPTHWAFGQLCARAKAPAHYLRTLPAELAVPSLQWSLEKHEAATDEGNDAKLLLHKGTSMWLRSVTSPTYGRIYDAEVTGALVKYIDPTVWKVPHASYETTDPLRATTLYASDHDIFVFLVDEDRPVEASGEVLKRGFYTWNSEVGSAKFGIAWFTYDHVCDNRIIWNIGNFNEITIRHTSGGPHRFVAKAVPALSEFAQSSDHSIVETIRKAKAKIVGKDRDSVLEWMRNRGFTNAMAKKSYEAAESDQRNYNPRSVWGLVQGATAVARAVPYQDDRVVLEQQAGNLLNNLME